ncbi:hypothetical protein [Rhodococcus sp. HNM0569]|uniref:hypothetical protein n=1 Tax=Rhodococcus sp. HNM0569 TaxID=2716340 RepID=UPI00146C1D84|nr:hypothetical protein [Rhodococcus sp. HNM0569]NLU82586.1 hypothetical protein [Rhodococcus sp. HNM0569]
MWAVSESADTRADWPQSPPPPWPASVHATLWWHRANDAARRHALPGRTIPITVAMVVDYLDSPVGPYREILASPVLRVPRRGVGVVPRMQIPFIAVDSATSVHGGRTHWRLPKVLAHFGGDVTGDSLTEGEGWSVRTDAAPYGPTLPIAGALGFAQPGADDSAPWLRASARLAGTSRPARVRVEPVGPTLGEWLVPSTHHGITITRGRMRTGPGRT